MTSHDELLARLKSGVAVPFMPPDEIDWKKAWFQLADQRNSEAKESAAAIRDLTAKLEAERGDNEKLGKKYADAVRLVNSYVDDLQIERDVRKKAELQAQALARTVMADQTSHDSGDDSSIAAYNLYERWTKGMKPETPTKTELRQHIQELQDMLAAERKAREEAERKLQELQK